MPLFSIVVPVYRVEEYLQECISSILQQSFCDFEIILIDDGSPDKCPLICDENAKSDDRIKVIHKKNGGLVSARKVGVNEASGEYILNVDSDDLVPSDLLSVLAGIISRYNHPDIIAFDYQNIGFDGTRMGIIRNQISEGLYNRANMSSIRKNLLYDTEQRDFNTGNIIYSIWSKALKRELAIKYQNMVPKSLTNGEDVAVVIPAVLNCDSLYVSKYVGYFYRERSASMVHSFKKSEIRSYTALLWYINSLDLSINECNIAGYSLRVFHSHIVKAAKDMPSRKAYEKYCNRIYNSTWKKYIGSFNAQSLSLIKKTIHTLIKKKKWNILWLYYHSK